MSVRGGYADEGVPGYYDARRATYRNPHESGVVSALRGMPLPRGPVLDMCAGSGEVTLALRALGVAEVEGCDPYTGPAYLWRTGVVAHPWSFEDVASGVLTGRRRYGLVVCSFALHLCEASRLPLVCQRLAEVSPALWVLTPHKRPVIRPGWGWLLMEEECYDPVGRVRLRVYAGVSREAGQGSDGGGGEASEGASR